MRCSLLSVCCDQLLFSCSSRVMISSTVSALKMRLISFMCGPNTKSSNVCEGEVAEEHLVQADVRVGIAGVYHFLMFGEHFGNCMRTHVL